MDQSHLVVISIFIIFVIFDVISAYLIVSIQVASSLWKTNFVVEKRASFLTKRPSFNGPETASFLYNPAYWKKSKF